jgi:hypothetical protein
MSKDDFDDDGFARPPYPLRARGKRVKIHQHSQHTVVECDGPYGPIHIESSTTITVESIEDDLPPYRFDDGFAQPSPRRLPGRKKR